MLRIMFDVKKSIRKEKKKCSVVLLNMKYFNIVEI